MLYTPRPLVTCVVLRLETGLAHRNGVQVCLAQHTGTSAHQSTPRRTTTNLAVLSGAAVTAPSVVIASWAWLTELARCGVSYFTRAHYVHGAAWMAPSLLFQRQDHALDPGSSTPLEAVIDISIQLISARHAPFQLKRGFVCNYSYAEYYSLRAC